MWDLSLFLTAFYCSTLLDLAACNKHNVLLCVSDCLRACMCVYVFLCICAVVLKAFSSLYSLTSPHSLFMLYHSRHKGAIFQ